ncbi:hypothetical protein GP475_11380 [Corynebacterium poyangense]|uniref:Uncharacterized protein n=1 Tax=Corynebacterium poyangense TaxID=2684405 RepID=A0A7H0SRI8_9CORY|nr:hypothetical protein [Corynebacterium poyangense]QNQ91163.1 hypothetical protein GP475_11380 [Corynebacterium poyangense]
MYALSFDSWRFLPARRHDVTVWRAFINPAYGGMPHYQGDHRADFELDVVPSTLEFQQFNSFTTAITTTAADGS